MTTLHLVPDSDTVVIDLVEDEPTVLGEVIDRMVAQAVTVLAGYVKCGKTNPRNLGRGTGIIEAIQILGGNEIDGDVVGDQVEDFLTILDALPTRALEFLQEMTSWKAMDFWIRTNVA